MTQWSKKTKQCADNDHLSLKGAEMINDLIMKEIEKIQLKLN